MLDLVVPTGLVLGRLMSRRVCEDCGAIYSTSSPPKFNWTCDFCGGHVVQREDDTEEAIKNRLAQYDQATAPLIARYAALGKLVEVSGEGSPSEVAANLNAVVDAYQHGAGSCRPRRGSMYEAHPRRDREDAACRQGRRRDARRDPGSRSAPA